MYISFSAEVIFVALHLFAYGSILLPITNNGKYVQILILILKNGPSAQRTTAIMTLAEENRNSSAFIPLNPFVTCTVRDVRFFTAVLPKIVAS
jgi:hypothetical protein